MIASTLPPGLKAGVRHDLADARFEARGKGGGDHHRSEGVQLTTRWPDA